MTARIPQFGERVSWEPLTPGAPLQFGSVTSVFPAGDAYRVSINWDVSDGEGRHETQHLLNSTSHVKFVEKDLTNV